MKAVLVGTDADPLGFSLAGTETYNVGSRDEVEKCVRNITTSLEDPIIIFSAHAAELITDKISQWAKRGSGPMFVVLPQERECH
jgi:vacuolar-type H+-ATPase subunit F/Vma7